MCGCSIGSALRMSTRPRTRRGSGRRRTRRCPPTSSIGIGIACHSGSPPRPSGPRQFVRNSRPTPLRERGAWTPSAQFGWSRRFRPTGRSATGSIPSRRSSPAGPMPERCRIGRRRVDAGREDDEVGLDLDRGTVGVDVADAGRPLAVEEHAIDEAVGAQDEVRPLPRGPDVGDERAEPHLVEAVLRPRPDRGHARLRRVQVGPYDRPSSTQASTNAWLTGSQASGLAPDCDRPVGPVKRVARRSRGRSRSARSTAAGPPSPSRGCRSSPSGRSRRALRARRRTRSPSTSRRPASPSPGARDGRSAAARPSSPSRARECRQGSSTGRR